MIASTDTLYGLRRQRPEWEPWLAVVEEMLREIGARRWAAAVPAVDHSRPAAAPLLAGARLSIRADDVSRLFQRLVRVAVERQTAKMATLDGVLRANVDVLALFTAALGQNDERVNAFAMIPGVDLEAFHAVVALLPTPVLQACNVRWRSQLRQDWIEGYCPVCGAWPAFAEVRGIERSRFFRCGRCGSEWHAQSLVCPYCATADHDELVALVPEKGGSHGTIDGCKRCLRYVKVLTRLQGCAPGAVMVEDLATVDLDVAALDHGFTRPAGAAYPFEVTVAAVGGMRRWRSAATSVAANLWNR